MSFIYLEGIGKLRLVNSDSHRIKEILTETSCQKLFSEEDEVYCHIISSSNLRKVFTWYPSKFRIDKYTSPWLISPDKKNLIYECCGSGFPRSWEERKEILSNAIVKDRSRLSDVIKESTLDFKELKRELPQDVVKRSTSLVDHFIKSINIPLNFSKVDMKEKLLDTLCHDILYISKDEDYIYITTKVYDLIYGSKNYAFGPYMVRIPLQVSSYTYKSTDLCREIGFRYTSDSVSRGFYCVYKTLNDYSIHPHLESIFNLNDWARPCFGNYVPIINTAMRNGDLPTLVKHVSLFLGSVASNWYNSITRYKFVKNSYLDLGIDDMPNLPLKCLCDVPIVFNTTGREDYRNTINRLSPVDPDAVEEYNYSSFVAGSNYISPYTIYDYDGDYYDPDGIDTTGRDVDGFDRSGFNRDGEDCNGNSWEDLLEEMGFELANNQDTQAEIVRDEEREATIGDDDYEEEDEDSGNGPEATAIGYENRESDTSETQAGEGLTFNAPNIAVDVAPLHTAYTLSGVVLPPALADSSNEISFDDIPF